MKPQLITYTPARIFTFGCSFTNYSWATWPEIIALELSIPLFNYGRGNAGNQYIFNMLMQADNHYKFTKDDLIIICWTNTYREDRYVNGQWHSIGDIKNNHSPFCHPVIEKDYWSEYLNDWGDPTSFLVRDLATIKVVDSFLQNLNCQYHFLSIFDITKHIDLLDLSITFNSNTQRLLDWYSHVLNKIQPSFYELIWNNDLNDKIISEKLIHRQLDDGHPLPLEHLNFLQQVFDHDFSITTIEKVNEIQEITIEKIKKELDEKPKPLGLVAFKHLVRNKK